MKTKATSQSAFLNLRILLATTFALSGAALVFAGIEQTATGEILAGAPMSHVTRAVEGLPRTVQSPVEPQTQAELARLTPATRSTFMATWQEVPGALGYRLDVSKDSLFTNFVDGFHDLDVGNVLGRVVTGLEKGTTYYYRVRAYTTSGIGNNLEVMTSATTSGAGLTINPTFDSSITSNGNSAAIQAAINQAISAEESLFSNTITINIAFRWTTTADPCGTPPSGFLGQSCWTYYNITWSTFISALKSHATTSNDTTANASLPSSALSTYIAATASNGRALGQNTPGGVSYNGGTYDGTITLNSTASFQFNRPTNAGNYDLIRTTEHEIDEVMGLGSNVTRSSNYRPQDLFSWSSNGARNFSSSGTRYFSINSGASNIVSFNQNSNGDFGDWISPSCPQANPYVQNAFSCSGQYSDVSATSPEGINLDVIGYTLVGSSGGGGPTITTTAATNVASTTATLNGTVNPNGTSTTVYFQYGTTTNYGSTSGTATATGTTTLGYNLSLSSLTPGQTYHYRFVGNYSGGTVYGGDMSFTTTGGTSPTITTTAATNVASTTATLNGTVNPNGTSTTVYFQYGTTTNYGSTSGTATATGTTTQSYHLNLSSLSPGQTYHYRFVGNYSGGTVYGGDMSFTTTGGASPTITTTAATNVASTTATLNGTVNPNGTSTTVYFQYGTTTNYGSTSGSATATGTTTLSYNLSLSSLTPGQTYHYRFAGNYSSGTVYGGDMSFTTQSSSGTPAQMTSTSSAITFNWSAGTATMYELSVGTSAGGSDLYDSGQTTALTATTQNNIPNNGSTIYVRLSSLVNGNWQSTDYTYTSFH